MSNKSETVAWITQKSLDYLLADEGGAINHMVNAYQKKGFGEDRSIPLHSADTVRALQLEAIRKALEVAQKKILDYEWAAGSKNFALMIAELDTETILNSMEGK